MKKVYTILLLVLSLPIFIDSVGIQAVAQDHIYEGYMAKPDHRRTSLELNPYIEFPEHIQSYIIFDEPEMTLDEYAYKVKGDAYGTMQGSINLKNIFKKASLDDDFIVVPVSYTLKFDKWKYENEQKKELSKLEQLYNNAASQYAEVYNKYMGKNFPNEAMKNTAQTFIQIARGAEVAPEDKPIQKVVVEAINPKDVKKIEEDYNKGKFSAKLKPVVLALHNHYKDLAKTASELKRTMFDPQTQETYIAANNPELFDIYKNGLKLTFYDTIPNVESRTNLIFNDPYRYVEKINNFTKGYEWVVTEKFTEEGERYPTPVGYDKYASHPDLRVKASSKIGDLKAIWDNKGNLVAVTDIPRKLYLLDGRDYFNSTKEVGADLYKIAWKENKYNIQSRPQTVTHYVKVCAGLENVTAAEKAKGEQAKAKRKQKLVNANNRYKRTGRGDTERTWAAMDYFFSDDSGLTPSEEGRNWLSQIISDNEKILTQIYSLERVDPTTFRVVYVDENMKPCYEMIIKFKAAKPYELDDAERTVKRLK